MVSSLHFVGIVLVLVAIVFVSVFYKGRTNNAKTFATGGGNGGAWMVCGTIMGTLVSGQATIGTAQLAFSYGISAMWFTFGSALGCLLLAIVYLKPLRQSGCTTLMEIVAKEYGTKVETIGSVLCSLGIFISVIAQIMAASAMIKSFFPTIPFWIAAVFSALLMTLYVVFGGIKALGRSGILKLILLYLSSVVAGLVAWYLSNGVSEMFHNLSNLFVQTGVDANLNSVESVRNRYLNPLSRGAEKDLGSCISLILGVVSTQSYCQGVWLGKSNQASRKGTLLSALLIPPIGMLCIFIGMFMRSHYLTTDEVAMFQSMGQVIPEGFGVIENASQAFPMFVINHLPKLFGGIVLGTLFITVIGGGAGLSFGAATIIVRDVISNIFVKLKKQMNNIVALRLTIVAISFMALFVALFLEKTFINDLGFLSFGLRATAVLLPTTAAMFFKKRFQRTWVLLSMILGTLILLIAKLLHLPFDPMFWGLGVSLLFMILGIKKTKATADRNF